MHLLSRPRRPRRDGEWNSGKVVTFIVTLAATQSVTLAARDAGMSRKSAYALKGRDPAFASAWNAALRAPKGDKVEEVHEPRFSFSQGDSVTGAKNRRHCEDWEDWRRAAPSISSARQRHAGLNVDAWRRDLFFERLAELPGVPSSLARRSPAQ